MLLYLMQHAEADSTHPDKPLSEKGKADAERTAAFLISAGVAVQGVLHSGKLRARETADAVASALGIRASETEWLMPKDEPSIWEERLQGMDEDTFLVGHLPHLSRLASSLLTGNSEAGTIAFRMAGLVCLERDQKGKWTLNWAVPPELMKS